VVRDRHRDWYVQLAEQAEPHLTAADQLAWLDVLEIERANLRAALASCWDSGNTNLGLRLAAALLWFWYVRGEPIAERRVWLDRFLEQSGGPALLGPRSKALAALVFCSAQAGDFALATRTWQEFRSVCELTGDRTSLVRAHWLLGRVALWRGDRPGAQTLFTQGVALAREAGDRWALAQELEGLGWVALDQGKNGEARQLFDECLLHFRGCQDWRAIAWTLMLVGNAACREGDYPAAHRYLEESQAIYERLRSKEFLGRVLRDLGVLARNEGDYTTSRTFLERSSAIGDEMALGVLNRDVQVQLGWLAREVGDTEEALALIRDGLAWSEYRPWFAEAQTRVGLTGICAAGILAIADRAYARGVQLLGCAAARVVLPQTLPPDLRRALEAGLRMARAELGQAVFDAEWAAGTAMNLEQAVAYASEGVRVSG
jgi:tetratricopeptide (TPR) repeat protein